MFDPLQTLIVTGRMLMKRIVVIRMMGKCWRILWIRMFGQ